MSELSEPKLKLEVSPGKINAVWDADDRVSLEVPLWAADAKRGIIRMLAGQAGEVYGLLQGRIADAVLETFLLPSAAELEGGSYSLLHEGKQTELLRLLRNQLAHDPWLAFALRGMNQAELLNGVFALWAEEQELEAVEDEPAKPSDLASELSRLERKGPPVTSGEWLVEAAAEGSLHQPGTLFHEIAERALPSAPVTADTKEEWQRLLPQTPKAREGLHLVMRRVSEAAVKRAQNIRKA
ncbi:hypothetical protein A8L34_18110 [Bacillus sp. FJAT-27264]|uniref:hypothetical protein n=1 Tax=Paenibacillus sp. (strain DSM 101736 / FJAT-27264) TaxID=1850362 RepID=UPI00080802C8|nr:hypothetical protein [Bacillus sp. FJAT-27264]OBZ10512.1 hypothetical protein A8L34_18110 [Bacillus sp. FJAT-27264]